MDFHVETCQIAPSSHWSRDQYCSSLDEEGSGYSGVGYSDADDQAGAVKY